MTNKECIACAEEIKAQAKLCKHCGTRQDDSEFSKPKKSSSTNSPTQKITKCLICSTKLNKAESSVCDNCQFGLSKHERDLLVTGVQVELCRSCEQKLYSPEISDECTRCEVRKANTWSILSSWWVQIILIVVVFLNPRFEALSGPATLFLTIGGQLAGTNAVLAAILWVVSLALGEKHKNYQKVKSWTLSTLLFLVVGLALMFLGFMFANGLGS
jgi:hypothetical protein